MAQVQNVSNEIKLSFGDDSEGFKQFASWVEKQADSDPEIRDELSSNPAFVRNLLREYQTYVVKASPNKSNLKTAQKIAGQPKPNDGSGSKGLIGGIDGAMAEIFKDIN
jgi:hypothetical protein